MKSDDKLIKYAYITLSLVNPKTLPKLLALIAHLGGIEPILSTKPAELAEKNGISSELIFKVHSFLDNFEKKGREIEDKTEEAGAGLLTYSDSAYPPLLRQIPDPPLVLYYKGFMPDKKEDCFSIVGSRSCDGNGYEAAFSIAKVLAEKKITVVSGMAYGIDAAAHKGTLNAGGRTIACLGTGLDIVYPPEHSRLFEEIIESGAAITEFLPGTPPLKTNFPRRNRIIAGISIGTAVIQAAKRSGSLLTAHNALAYGREVMALPGSVFSRVCEGTNSLIKDGAALIRNGYDVLEIIKPDSLVKKKRKSFSKQELSKDEKEIFSLIDGNRCAMEIAEQSLLPVPIVFANLSALELKGFIKCGLKGIYTPVK